MASPTLISRPPYKIWRAANAQELNLRVSDIKCSASSDLGGMAVGGSSLLSASTAVIYYSTDGKTFSSAAGISTIFSSAVPFMAQNGSYFLAISQASGASLKVARAPITDPSNWTQITPTGNPASASPISLIAINNTFIIIDGNYTIYTSTDGQTWTAGATISSGGINWNQANSKIIGYYSAPLDRYIILSGGSTNGFKAISSATLSFSSITGINGTTENFTDPLYAKSIETLIANPQATASASSTPFHAYVQFTQSATEVYKGTSVDDQIIPPQLITSAVSGQGSVSAPASNWIHFDEATDYISMYIHNTQSAPAIYSWNMKNASSPTYTQIAGAFAGVTVNSAHGLTNSVFWKYATAQGLSAPLRRHTLEFKGKTIRILNLPESRHAILIGEYA